MLSKAVTSSLPWVMTCGGGGDGGEGGGRCGRGVWIGEPTDANAEKMCGKSGLKEIGRNCAQKYFAARKAKGEWGHCSRGR